MVVKHSTKNKKISVLFTVLLVLVSLILNSCVIKNFSSKSGGERHMDCSIPKQQWSALIQSCVSPVQIADIKIYRSDKNSAVYVIFSRNRSYVEVFTDDISEYIILEAVKGGYISADGKTRLLRHESKWVLVR